MGEEEAGDKGWGGGFCVTSRLQRRLRSHVQSQVQLQEQHLLVTLQALSPGGLSA